MNSHFILTRGELSTFYHLYDGVHECGTGKVEHKHTISTQKRREKNVYCARAFVLKLHEGIATAALDRNVYSVCVYVCCLAVQMR